jgi:hypothetical protein
VVAAEATQQIRSLVSPDRHPLHSSSVLGF